ncbi:hypothetical protein B566_EDAN010953 [Ephemera danica]|nr:hypothetical protein B566_EDAN010953 [Ephemera danica]
MQKSFRIYASTVLESLVQSCPELKSPDWIELAAQKNTQTLSLRIEQEDIFATICRLIQDKCKNLRGLWLTWNAEAENKATVIEILSTLLRSLPYLRVLKLRSFPITDECLEVIAKTCTQLSLGDSQVDD